MIVLRQRWVRVPVKERPRRVPLSASEGPSCATLRQRPDRPRERRGTPERGREKGRGPHAPRKARRPLEQRCRQRRQHNPTGSAAEGEQQLPSAPAAPPAGHPEPARLTSVHVLLHKTGSTTCRCPASCASFSLPTFPSSTLPPSGPFHLFRQLSAWSLLQLCTGQYKTVIELGLPIHQAALRYPPRTRASNRSESSSKRIRTVMVRRPALAQRQPAGAAPAAPPGRHATCCCMTARTPYRLRCWDCCAWLCSLGGTRALPALRARRGGMGMIAHGYAFAAGAASRDLMHIAVQPGAACAPALRPSALLVYAFPISRPCRRAPPVAAPPRGLLQQTEMSGRFLGRAVHRWRAHPGCGLPSPAVSPA